jgi:manganese oxidase
VVNSLAPLARAEEPASSASQELVKSDANGQNSEVRQFSPGEPGKDYSPVITLNGSTLPYKIVDGVKVFSRSRDDQ